MKIVFAILAVLFYLGGFLGCVGAKAVTHEIAGLITLVIATLFAIGAGIIEAIDKVRDQLRRPPIND